LAKPELAWGEVSLSTGLIFDPGDYIELDLLILKPLDTTLEYRASGKISRQPKIPVVDRTAPIDEGSLIERSFGGGVVEQILRLVGYFIIGSGLLVLTGHIWSWAAKRRSARRARRRGEAAVSALERIGDFESSSAGIALGVFSFLGSKYSRRFLSSLNSQFTRSDKGKIPAKEIEIFGRTIKANRESVNSYLEESVVTSPASINIMLREFDIIGGHDISSAFIDVLEKVVETAGMQASRYGTGLSDFARERFDETE
jgi:hypothetical protein